MNSVSDWAIARTGSVFIENASEDINISSNYFDSVGRNGVTLSKHARNCAVSHNRFAFPGDSPVALLGREQHGGWDLRRLQHNRKQLDA